MKVMDEHGRELPVLAYAVGDAPKIWVRTDRPAPIPAQDRRLGHVAQVDRQPGDVL